jgi:hypothetical protein
MQDLFFVYFVLPLHLFGMRLLPFEMIVGKDTFWSGDSGDPTCCSSIADVNGILLEVVRQKDLTHYFRPFGQESAWPQLAQYCVPGWLGLPQLGQNRGRA